MTFWKDKIVLVTGGHGFVGTHVVRMLKDLEAVVHAPSRYDYDLTVEHQVDLMFKHLKLKRLLQKSFPKKKITIIDNKDGSQTISIL